jgi:tetratricopeptide (TPR) repeat protein
MDDARGSQAQQVTGAGRNAYTAGRDLAIVSISTAGTGEVVVPGLLPRDVPGFIGRADELACLTGLAGGGSVVVTAIGGTAGVGKTALAVRAAHRLLAQFPDGHLYADLRGYTEGQAAAESGEVLEVFLRRLGVAAEAVPAGTAERSGLFRQLLASLKVLVVLDNAATEEQVRPLLPGAGASLVLITSRSALAGLELDGRIDLDVLPDSEAVALLAKIIGAERAAADPRALARVARSCGCLPLALRIAGQLLVAHPAWSATRLAAMLADERDRLDRLSAGDRQVRTAFVTSYRLLPEPDARMFRLLGLHPGPDIDTTAAAALAGIDPQEAELVLDRLVLAHLITEDRAGWFGMHDLLRLFARQICQDHDDEATLDAALGRLAGHFANLAEYLGGCVDPEERPGIAEAAAAAGESVHSVRQALEMFEAHRPNMVAVVGMAAEHAWLEEVQRISENMVDALNLLHHPDDLLIVTRTALTTAQAKQDEDAEGRALSNLGYAYSELRQFEESVTCYEDALAVCRRTGDHSTERTALTGLGNSYLFLRRLEEAATCQQDALTMCRGFADEHDEGMALGSLGHTYQEMRRYEESVTCYQDALAIFRATGDHRRESMALAHLGDTYESMRRYEEAISSYADALTIIRENGFRHDEGMALNNLGGTYEAMRRYEEAVAYYRDALAILRDVRDQYGEGTVLRNLGDTYESMRRHEEAAAHYRDSLAIFRENGYRDDEGLALGSLCEPYREMRRFDEAVTCAKDALAIFHETGYRDGEGAALTNLGDAYRNIRRFDEAVTCAQDALAIFRETGYRDGEGTALTNLGDAYQEMQRFDEAVTCAQEALAIFRETEDRHAEGTVLGIFSLACQHLGRFAEAAASGQDALAALRETGDLQAAAELGQKLNESRKHSRHRWPHRNPRQ